MYSLYSLYTPLPVSFRGFTFLSLWIRITLKRMKYKVPLGFIVLDNRIIINYVMNRTYILQASKPRPIQVNCLLNLRYEFKYPMAINITRYNDILLYTFNAQAVNHSPYAGFRFNYVKMKILSFQSRTNTLRLSSLKGWV